MTSTLVNALLVVLVVFGLLPPLSAWGETTGMRSPKITIFFGTGDVVEGSWHEDTLTIDGQRAYCVEVDETFEEGLDVHASDPIAKGIWSQELCTELALIDQFVSSGNFVSTRNGNGDGHKVSDADEQYAVAQCYIWKFLNDEGFSEHSYGWFGASSSTGRDLTGSDTNAQIWDYINANLSYYEGSATYYDCGSAQSLACNFSLQPTKGNIVLQKESSDKDLVEDNAEYSLEQAKYGVYSSQDCKDDSLVCTLETNAEGYAKSEAIARGQYYVRELQASAGFKIDSNIYPVEVLANQDCLVNPDAGSVYEQPQTGSLSLRKTSSNPAITTDNNCYSLSGALYGIYRDDACSELIAKIETDEEGKGSAEGLPLGTCYIREISAPAGYALDTTTYSAIVQADEVVYVNGGSIADVPKNNPFDLVLAKYDDEKSASLDGNSPQGSASLAGAEFEISFYPGYYDRAEEAQTSGEPLRSWTFKTDENGLIRADESHLVSGDALYYTSDGQACLPLGTVVIRETVAPSGHLKNDEMFCIQITNDGTSGESIESYIAPLVPNQVKRGDFEFVKTSESQTKRLAGVPFKVTSDTTGESHVLVTDENGYACTAASWNAHTLNTNGNDWALEQSGAASEAEQPEDGEGEENAPEESAKEIVSEESESNDGEIESADGEGDNADSEAGSTSDENTSASSKVNNADNENEKNDFAHETSFDTNAGIWFGYGDDASYSIAPDNSRGALPFDTYTIEELPCEANEGLQLIQANVVISRDNTVIDLGTIDDPEAGLATSAFDAADSDKSLSSSVEASIVDRVSCYNLLPGSTCTITGTLMNAETGAALCDESGKVIQASSTFTAESQTVTQELSFTFSSYGLEGQRIVVFERLDCDGRTIATHEDIDDEQQSVHIASPHIATVASTGEDGGRTIGSEKTVHIVDTVYYTGLCAGSEYRLKAMLMDKQSAQALETSGGPIQAESVFTPESSSGHAQVEFELDNSSLDTNDVVIFEQLFAGDTLIASHEDINDEQQSLSRTTPRLQTSLFDAESNTKYASLGQTILLTDTITYTDLIPGKTYTVSGKLMDKTNGEAFLDSQGMPVEASMEFVPENSQGSVNLSLGFDSNLLEEKQVVAFESLSCEGTVIAAHEDINDDLQTVQLVAPHIQTAASGSESESKSITNASGSTINDEVSITGAVAGHNYLVVGILMDKTSGLPLVNTETDTNELNKLWMSLLASASLQDSIKANGSLEDIHQSLGVNIDEALQVIRSNSNLANALYLQAQSIEAPSSSFSLTMSYPIRANQEPGETVVFEALIDETNGKLVALHADMTDEDQCVEITEEKTPKESETKAPSTVEGTGYDKTGNLIAQYWWLAALLLTTGTLSAAYAFVQRKAHQDRVQEFDQE